MTCMRAAEIIEIPPGTSKYVVTSHGVEARLVNAGSRVLYARMGPRSLKLSARKPGSYGRKKDESLDVQVLKQLRRRNG